MTDYGVLANIVGTVTSLAAAGGAITLAFTKRAKWQPPEEAVPKAVSRVAGLVTMVGVALLYAFSTTLGVGWLAAITVGGLALTVGALSVAITTNIKHACYWPEDPIEANRHLGGDVLTGEASRIARERGLKLQQLFADAQGDKDLVWTRDSQAAVHIRSTLSYILLIGAGACSLAAAGMLVAAAAPATPAAHSE